jgi:hypothetical protein
MAEPQSFKSTRAHGASGFALVSLLILVPFLMALTLAVTAIFYALKRKSLAQSICVQEATRLQEDLRVPLRGLLALNPQAQRLRRARQAAERALQTAVASGVPHLIAAAKATRTAVLLAQAALAARQAAWLTQARVLRAVGQRELRQRVWRLGAVDVRSPTSYFRALAVEPRQAASLTPDYVPITRFADGQQQRYRYRVDLLAAWPLFRERAPWMQTSECSVTLQNVSRGEEKWQIRILAANAAPSS